MTRETLNGAVLDALYAVIESRRGGDPESSYTARLLDGGPAKIAQKVGEEAVETVIEAARANKEGVISESADLLYHLLALWAASGVAPEEIWGALESRKGTSGIAEKAARKQD